MKLLIVEDNATSAQALCHLLSERMEYIECKVVDNLADALKESEAFAADITLLDLHLPGSTVAQVIHSIPLFSPPVIVVSSEDDNAITIECFRYKAQNVLTKAALLEKIDSLAKRIETDKLIRAITDAHFRNILPKTVDDGRT